MSPARLPQVTVVLVNWNGLQDTLDCIESLRQTEYGNRCIVVVDNGSDNHQAAAIQQRFTGVQVHATDRNLGFTGGNNLGIKLALAGGADYILCLNNDTVVAPDSLGKLVEAMEANPHAGLATAAIYKAHQPTVLDGLGCRLRFDLLLCGEHLREFQPAQLSSPFEVPYAEGCALMIRRAAAEQAGGFDDAFFAYFEDADLCLRAKAQGWTSLAVPLAHVWHKIDEKPSGSGSPTACFYSARNSWLLVRRHASDAQRGAFRRRYPRQALGLVRDLVYLRASGLAPAAVRREYDCKSALLLGTTAGFLGFKGRRDTGSWPAWEKVLRAGLNAFISLCLPLAKRLPRRLS